LEFNHLRHSLWGLQQSHLACVLSLLQNIPAGDNRTPIKSRTKNTRMWTLLRVSPVFRKSSQKSHPHPPCCLWNPRQVPHSGLLLLPSRKLGFRSKPLWTTLLIPLSSSVAREWLSCHPPRWEGAHSATSVQSALCSVRSQNVPSARLHRLLDNSPWWCHSDPQPRNTVERPPVTFH
jgi:hypothetical protein